MGIVEKLKNLGVIVRELSINTGIPTRVGSKNPLILLKGFLTKTNCL